MKPILTLALLFFLSTTNAQTSINPVTCNEHNYYVRVTFIDSVVPVHDVSPILCPDGTLHYDTEEGEWVECQMELFNDAACTQPVTVDPRFFAFARDEPGSAGTVYNPTISYDYNCSAIMPPGPYGDNWRTDFSNIYTQPCIWECVGSGYYNCYVTGPGVPNNYNLVINCCYAPSVLAVRLVSFDGVRRAGVNVLSWGLENKQDFARLEVERSFDGVHYSVVYSSVDVTVSSYADGTANTAYYRLRVYNNNNTTFLSSVVVLKAVSLVPGFVVSPSPFRDVLNVAVYAVHNARCAFKLVSAEGKTVLSVQRDVKTGANKVTLPVPPVCKGVYILTMSNDEGMTAVKVLKQ